MLEGREIGKIAVIEGTFRKYPTLKKAMMVTYPKAEIFEVGCMEQFIRGNVENDNVWAFVTERRLFPVDFFSTVKFLNEKLGARLSNVVLIRPAVIEGIGFDDEVSHFTEMRIVRSFDNFTIKYEDRASEFMMEQKVSER